MTARAIVLLERDGSEWPRWLLAGAIVLAAHLALVASYLFLVVPKPQGALEFPAIVIDMAPLPVAPASPLDVAPGPEMVEAAPQPEPKPIEPPPERVAEPPPPEAIAPLVALPEPPPPEPIVPLVALPEPPPPPPPEVKKEPAPEAQPEKKPEAQPETKPEAKPETKPETKLEKSAEPRKDPAPRTAAAPRSDRNNADRLAAPSAGASQAAALASWRDQVVTLLQRAKRYPGGAESRREQGVVTLNFTLSRAGAVLGRRIARSSGSSELDQEALAMVARAQPFPPFPAGMNQGSVNLSVPVRFSLR